MTGVRVTAPRASSLLRGGGSERGKRDGDSVTVSPAKIMMYKCGLEDVAGLIRAA